MKTLKVIIGAGEALELTAGWLDIEASDPDAVYLLPVRYKRVGELGHYYLIAVGDPVGKLAVEVMLTRPQDRKAR